MQNSLIKKYLIISFVLLSFLLPTSAQSESEEMEDLCAPAISCSECIRAAPWCSWCSYPFIKNSSHCFEYDPDEDLPCYDQFLVYPYSKHFPVTNINLTKMDSNEVSDPSNFVQIQPQEIRLELRIRK